MSSKLLSSSSATDILPTSLPKMLCCVLKSGKLEWTDRWNVLSHCFHKNISSISIDKHVPNVPRTLFQGKSSEYMLHINAKLENISRSCDNPNPLLAYFWSLEASWEAAEMWVRTVKGDWAGSVSGMCGFLKSHHDREWQNTNCAKWRKVSRTSVRNSTAQHTLSSFAITLWFKLTS